MSSNQAMNTYLSDKSCLYKITIEIFKVAYVMQV
jgi:hypothetical protein